jgi:sporulation protein YlmC with PRC-barrel domain
MGHDLIASDRVEGTPVCRSTGEQIGVIQRVMINKMSGRIAYAVLTFGGFLGFGQKHFPVPWRSLKYKLQQGAYELDVTDEQLRAAPSFAPAEEFDWGDRSDEMQIVVRHYPVHHGW